MGIDKQSVNHVMSNLEAFIKSTNKAAFASMADVLSYVEEKAISRTPLDTGNLRTSFYGKVNEKGENIAGEIGNNAKYALYVHENLESHHPIGEAKFLEKAITENTSEIKSIFLNRLKV